MQFIILQKVIIFGNVCLFLFCKLFIVQQFNPVCDKTDKPN